MTLIKINPEDLVVGQKYLVELEFKLNDGTDAPYCFNDVKGSERWFHKDQPIYTHEPSTDTELEMLVNVASRIYTDTLRSEPIDECVKKAQKIITACKNALKEVSHD